MTRSEYQAKYGAAPEAPVASANVAPVDSTSTEPVKMTRAEYAAKYGAPVETKVGTGIPILDKNPIIKAMGTNANAGKVPATAFGTPIKDINAAGADVNAAISGTGQYEGQGAIRRGFSAASTAALAVPTVVADVIPGGKAAMETISKGFEGATKIAGNAGNMLADIAQKAGIMSEAQRKLYDKNNAEFANSPIGAAIDSTASVLNSAGNIANVILMAHGAAESTQKFIDKKVPVIKENFNTALKNKAQAKQAGLVSDTADQIAAVEAKYAKGRKANLYSKDAGAESRQRVAGSGVLEGTVDNNGLIRTTDPGGAVDQYKAMTIDPAEGVVRQNLAREGAVVNLSVVEKGLVDAVNKSGLEGADLVNALNGVKKEVAGLRLKADASGDIPTTLLHDAKINTTKNINYQTPPETATFRKAVARGYKALVEDNSSFNVKEVNAELAKYYDDIARLERLDGMRVIGGRLGKYTAQISGNIVGGAIGGAIGGLPGAAIGTIIGGETSGFIKGASMSKTFNGVKNGVAPKSPVLEKAIESAKGVSSPRSAGGTGSAISPVQRTIGSQMPLGKNIPPVAGKVKVNRYTKDPQGGVSGGDASKVVPVAKGAGKGQNRSNQGGQEGIYRYSEKGGAPVTRESTKKGSHTVPKR